MELWLCEKVAKDRVRSADASNGSDELPPPWLKDASRRFSRSIEADREFCGPSSSTTRSSSSDPMRNSRTDSEVRGLVVDWRGST
mmetsp:Transcript_9805/g.19263  ORF Transcript_9805/g.19263 Transcript_9805/m.19263 type:complete len:85 (-) Transcript_9805:914-1168(-)